MNEWMMKTDNHVINNPWTQIRLSKKQQYWKWIHARPWQQEIGRWETLLPHRSPLLPLAQVQQWSLGRWGMEIEDWRRRLMLTPASHQRQEDVPGIRSIDRPVSSSAQMDEGGQGLSVEASAVQAEIHPVSVWCERLRGYQVGKNIWTVGRLQMTFAALTLCSQFSVFLLRLGIIYC